jgi:hypothetical protein
MMIVNSGLSQDSRSMTTLLDLLDNTSFRVNGNHLREGGR